MRGQTAGTISFGRRCVFRSNRIARDLMPLVSVVHRGTAMQVVMAMGLVGRSRRFLEHQPLHHSFVARPAKKHCGRSHALYGHGNHHDPNKEGADNLFHCSSLADSP